MTVHRLAAAGATGAGAAAAALRAVPLASPAAALQRAPCAAAELSRGRRWRAASFALRRASSSSDSGFFYNDPGPQQPHESLRPGPQSPRTRGGFPLPEGWAEYHSPSRGVYFAHPSTGVTQWDFPTGPPSQRQIKEAFLQKHGDRVAALCPGARVQLGGLVSAPQLNGMRGTVQQWDIASGYVRVRLDAGQVKDVKVDNVSVMSTETPGAREVKKQRARQQEAEAGGTAAPAGLSGSNGRLLSERVGAAAFAGGFAACWLGYKWYEAQWFSTRTSKLDGSTF